MWGLTGGYGQVLNFLFFFAGIERVRGVRVPPGRIHHQPEVLPRKPKSVRGLVRPQPSTLHPQPSTLNSRPSTLNPQPSPLNPPPSPLNPQPSTLNPQPSTLNPEPSTLNQVPRGVRDRGVRPHISRRLHCRVSRYVPSAELGERRGGVLVCAAKPYVTTSLIRNSPPPLGPP